MLRIVSVFICLLVILAGDLLATGWMGPVGKEGAVVHSWLAQTVRKHSVLSADMQRAPAYVAPTIQSRVATKKVSEGVQRIGANVVALLCTGLFFVQRQRSLV